MREGENAMATVLRQPIPEDRLQDHLSGTNRAHALDRWIYVVSVALFLVIVLVGFIPDSLMKIAMVEAGQRAPFPVILHVHAVLMGSYLLFLLSQTWLVATGRTARHRAVGPIGGLLAVALVVVGFILAPTMYHQVAGALETAPAAAQPQLGALLKWMENILLLQTQAGILFALFTGIGLAMRNRDPGLHKRMMIIAPAMALGAAFARMPWLPHTMPASPLSIQLYQLLALAPLFTWDVMRNGRIHRAYWILGVAYLSMCLLIHQLWDTPGWHAFAQGVLAP